MTTNKKMTTIITLQTIKKAKLIERMVDYYKTIGAKNPLLQAILIVEEKEKRERF